MEPGVTVVIPSYNPGRYLTEALESVFRQTYSQWKLILIDDASTDSSLAQAAKYLEDPRVTLIRNPVNVGQSKSLNIALEFVRTEFMVQLDSDDWFYPETLEVLINAASELTQDIAIIGGNIKVVFEDSNGRITKIIVKKGRFYGDRYDFLLSNNSVWPRFFRTSCLRAVGGWPTNDPYQGRYVEDKRILLRLIEDYRFHWVDHLLYKHRRHASNQTKNKLVINRMVKYIIKEALQRWGNEFVPLCKVNKSGSVKLVQLIPLPKEPLIEDSVAVNTIHSEELAPLEMENENALTVVHKETDDQTKLELIKRLIDRLNALHESRS